MSVATLARKTEAAVNELLPLWQARTTSDSEKSEEITKVLVARSVVDALLDMKSFVAEYDAIDLAQRTAA